MEKLTNILNQLKRPFETKKVHWRIGATNVKKDTDDELKWGDKPMGQAMCYIDSRDVMRRLDDLFPMQWQDLYTHANIHDKGGVYICKIGLNINGEWLWRSNGAGETAFEAEKGGMSDAFKRAAVMWGIGQYLYKLPSEWVPISKSGRDWKLMAPPTLPDWATPEGYDRLILKIKPHSERNVVDLINLLEGDEPYKTYAYLQELPDGVVSDLCEEFPHGSKTAMKKKLDDHRHQGRMIMIEIADDLGAKIDADEGLGVIGILEDESERMQEIIIKCLTIEQQDKLKIIQEEV